MDVGLAPLRRAEDLLMRQECVDAIVGELQLLFGLQLVDAFAAVSAVLLLHERGISVAPERSVDLAADAVNAWRSP